MWVIRNSGGDIENVYDTKEEACDNLRYYSDEFEVTSAEIEEVFEHEFQGVDINELVKAFAN